jgi:type I restriction enzyme, S subunit
VIPEGWNESLLDSVANRGSGHTPDKGFPEYWDGGIKWVSLADSKRLDNRLIYETDKQISATGLRNSSAVLHPEGTVILSRDAGVGKSAILASEMAVSQHFIVWRCKPKNKLCNRFLYYWLQWNKTEFERIAVGSTIKTIGLPYFKKLTIKHPPLEEQVKIAEVLTAWDDALETLGKLIAAKLELKRGLMQALLTGKKRFQEFKTREWQSVPFGEMTKPSSQKFDPKAVDKSFPCIELEHIDQGTGTLLAYTDSKKQLSIKNKFTKNDVLFGKLRPYLKKFLLAPFEGVCSTEIWVLQPGKNVSGEYLFRIVQSQEFIGSANVSSGSKMPRADWEYISEVTFKVPPLEEQIRIAEVLTTLDTELEGLRGQLQRIKTQKKGLMQHLLTGKTRVKV